MTCKHEWDIVDIGNHTYNQYNESHLGIEIVLECKLCGFKKDSILGVSDD